MALFSLIIILEILASFTLLSLSPHSQVEYKANTLGVQIAQENSDVIPGSSEEPTSAPVSVDEQTTPTPDQNQPTNESTTTPDVKEPILVPDNFLTPETSLLDQIVNSPTPSIPQQNKTGEANSPINSEESSPIAQILPILNPVDLITSSENISDESVEKVKKEEEKLGESKNPQEEGSLLIDFSKDKIKDIDKFLRSDDFASTNFATLRLNVYLDRLVENIQKAPLSDGIGLKSKLKNFCKQADFILRSEELTIPEEAEQDVEIARGKCLETQL